MLGSYLAMLRATEYPMQLGSYSVLGSMVDYLTEEDPNAPQSDMLRFEPGVSQRVIIGIDRLPSSWEGYNEGQLVAAIQPLPLTSDGLTYNNRGVRVGRLMGEKAYIEILLAEAEYTEVQVDDALRWEDWTRRRFIPDGGISAITKQPTGTWPETEIEMSLVDDRGDALTDFASRTGFGITRKGTLKVGDRLYRNNVAFEVFLVEEQGQYERARLVR